MLKTICSNIGALLSQTAHTIFFPRHPANPDITISARAHVEAEYYGSPGWTIARDVIDTLFFWQKDHCALSFARDVRNADLFKSYASGLRERA